MVQESACLCLLIRHQRFVVNLQQAIAQLTEETDRELAPYPDWTRPMNVPRDSYHGEFLTQLHTFMRSPELESYEFKARAEIRDSISNHIRSENLDLDQQTIKGSVPHTLRLTKNSDSYTRAVKQRQSDLKLLAKLVAL